MTKILNKMKIRLTMLISSVVLIIFIEILHQLDYNFLSKFRVLWQLLIVLGAYITPIIYTEFNQHTFEYEQFKSEVKLGFMALVAPILMLLGIIIITVSILGKTNNYYFGLYILNFGGFFLYFYAHKGELFDEYQEFQNNIDQFKRDHNQNF